MPYPKKPTALKVLHGTTRKDRSNPNEPVPDLGIPDPPDFLSEAALKEWIRITPELLALGLLTKIDRAALAFYCQLWGRVVEYEGKIEIEPDQDTIFKLIRVADRAYDQARKFLTEFGLSPASRSKVSAKKSEKKTNPFAKLGR